MCQNMARGGSAEGGERIRDYHPRPQNQKLHIGVGTRTKKGRFRICHALSIALGFLYVGAVRCSVSLSCFLVSGPDCAYLLAYFGL